MNVMASIRNRKKSSFIAERVAAIYLVISLVWILFSDRLLLMFISDPQVITEIQTVKGVLFVLGSALVILLLLRRELRIFDQVERHLNESRGKYRLLVENQNDLVVRFDMGGIIGFASPSFYKFFKKDLGELLGSSLFTLVFPDDAKLALRRMAQISRDGFASGLEGRVLVAGEVRWISWVVTKVVGEQGEGTDSFMAVGREITARRLALEDLKESQERFRVLFENNPIACWLEDLSEIGRYFSRLRLQGVVSIEDYFLENPESVVGSVTLIRVIDVNQATLDLHRASSKEDLLVNLGDTFTEESYNVFRRELIDLWNGHTTGTYLGQVKTLDGEPREVSIRFNVVSGSEESLSRVLFSITDITEQRKTEEELQKIHRLQSIGTLAGGIAHDFNNILTGIFGNISMAREVTRKDDRSYLYLENAEKSLNRATRLTKQLLTFAKGGEPSKELVNVVDLVTSVVEFDLSGSKVKPVFASGNSLWSVEIDKGQIQQVFSNLTINSVQAMPKGGRLYVSFANIELESDSIVGLSRGKYVMISLRDEGLGISEENLNRIFDPYFSTKPKGVGLGLATVHSIINRHQGHIRIESIEGEGTTFHIYLPVGITDLNFRIDDSNSQSANSREKLKSGRILVMDDEEMIRNLLKAMLGGLGYQVTTVDGGEAALEAYQQAIAEEKYFAAVIMDLTIPGGMGGEEAVEKLLAIDPEAVAIVTSGYSNNPVLARYRKYGFQGILTKPFTRANIKTTLENVFGSDMSGE